MTSSGGPRGNYANGARTRQAIIDAAVEHFAKFGYRGAPLASIAESVGVTRSGLLHHFRSKEELLTAALDRRDEMATEALRQSHAESPGAMSFVTALLRDELVHNRGLVQLFTALVGESVSAAHPAHDHLRERYSTTRALFRRLLEEGKAEGWIPADVDVDRAAPLMIAVMDGLQVQWLYDESLNIADLFESFLACLPRKADTGPPLNGRTTESRATS